MKALAAIRAGSYNDLMSSALDVTLKGSRRLLLTVPEILLNDIDLDNMLFPVARRCCHLSSRSGILHKAKGH
ncbi:unnamed protein product, partial [Clonostachys rosea f. rosea IK726]|jgi:3-polyprenyl-4-hydroxybenzoate decarboxylase